MIVLPGCPSLQTGWPGSVWNGGRDQIGTVAAITLEYMAGMRWNPQIVVSGDLGHVALIEQGELQWSALCGKLADSGRAQRSDPVQASKFDIGFKPRVGDHAAIADQHDAAEVEACSQLGDLGGEPHRVCG